MEYSEILDYLQNTDLHVVASDIEARQARLDEVRGHVEALLTHYMDYERMQCAYCGREIWQDHRDDCDVGLARDWLAAQDDTEGDDDDGDG